ncbi:MAG: peptidase domain-containing ABC transporter [Nocardioides sp.]|nr:peptidase domain-containing ABC transporter [Nocardioides sp.]
MSRVRFVFQMTSTECGLACLAMVAGALGRRTTLAALRERIEVGRDGVSALALVAAADSLGLRARAVAAPAERLADRSQPWIAVWEDSHFVVVQSLGPRRVDVLDPARGRRRMSREEFDAGYQGIALLFEAVPGAVVEDVPRSRVGAAWRPLRAEARRAGGIFLALVAVTVVAQLLTLAGPFLIGRAVDELGGSAAQLPTTLALGVAGVVVATWLVGAARGIASVRLQQRLDERLAPGFFGHLLSLPHHELERRGTGDLMGRMESLTLARLALTGQVVGALLDAGLVVIACVALFTGSTSFGLVVLAAIALQVVPLVVLAGPLHESTSRAAMCEGSVHGFTAESLQGIATVKSIGAEDAARQRFALLAADRRAAETRRDRLAARVETVLTTVRCATPLAILLLGFPAVASGELAVGALVTAVGLATAAVLPASGFVSGARAVQAAHSHLVRLADIWALAPEVDAGEVELEGAVELRGVGLRYPGSAAWALEDVSLRIAPGEHVAVVGRSGSGKSTLVKVLVGLLAPSAGEVRYDGRPASSLSLPGLRRAMGVVLQEVWLFAGTIRDNITVERRLTDDDVRRAAALAGIADDIEALPLGYDTRLADGGAGISGGQRQRIALARALAHRPRVVVLDEATSHLDAVSEARVADSLVRMGVTRISVAHRLSTVRHADRIVVVEQGRVVQVGSYDELAEVPGVFRDLVSAQLSEPAPELV